MMLCVLSGCEEGDRLGGRREGAWLEWVVGAESWASLSAQLSLSNHFSLCFQPASTPHPVELCEHRDLFANPVDFSGFPFCSTLAVWVFSFCAQVSKRGGFDKL